MYVDQRVGSTTGNPACADAFEDDIIRTYIIVSVHSKFVSDSCRIRGHAGVPQTEGIKLQTFDVYMLPYRAFGGPCLYDAVVQPAFAVETHRDRIQITLLREKGFVVMPSPSISFEHDTMNGVQRTSFISDS